MTAILDRQTVRDYAAWLTVREKSPGTVENYTRHVDRLAAFLAGRPLTKGGLMAWKQELQARGYRPATVNAMIVSVNGYLKWAGLAELRLTTLRVQRCFFREEGRVLSRADYEKLVETALARGKTRLALVMETLCATGIRVSELRYISLEAVCRGRADIRLKGKIRTILIPGKLCKKLKKYAEKQKIASGELFRTGGGASLGRRQIWQEMKGLCELAGVAAGKVFPHNLRRLFARCFYRVCRDLSHLADTLGHSSVETTRLYLAISADQASRTLDRLGLVT